MLSPNAVKEILSFAITREEESRDFYIEMSKKLKKPAMAKLFEDFSKEEAKHIVKLTEVQNGAEIVFTPQKINDLKIADYTIIDERTTDVNYQQALLIAMRREKKAFQLYTNLSEAAVDDTVRNLFAYLAQEEAKHKLRIEIEYDEQVLNEN